MIIKKECSNAFLEYANQIMFVKIKLGSTLSIQTMQEQYALQNEMVGDDIYAVLVDGTNNSNAEPGAREMMAKHCPVNRVATAIITNNNIIVNIIANFYIKVNKPQTTTKLFHNKEDALDWLNIKLKKKVRRI